MSTKETWTPEEEEVLREKYPTTKNKMLSAQLNRSIDSIKMKASRLGLIKEIKEEPADQTDNKFILMSREDAMKLDKFDLLSWNWGLLEMFRRELNNPSLRPRDRVKLMCSMSAHTVTINSIMKGSEDQLGEEEDLKAVFLRLKSEDENQSFSSRRFRIGESTFVITRDIKKEAKKNKSNQRRPTTPS